MSAIKPSGVVTLLTDFGTQDPFVGVMKGVLLSRYPKIRIVDLTHEIAPQDVAEGAFWLFGSYRWFPEGTVHVAVVDPGVGTSRAELAVEADSHYFVAPDNGVLGPVLARAKDAEVRKIARAAIGAEKVSRTFHGRDVFAPAAAELAGGGRWLTELGPIVEPAGQNALPRPGVQPGEVTGRVVTADRFGNLITNIRAKHVAAFRAPLVLAGAHRLSVSQTYMDVAPGAPLALIDAFDALEIAVREGNARSELNLAKGAPIRVVEGRLAERGPAA